MYSVYLTLSSTFFLVLFFFLASYLQAIISLFQQNYTIMSSSTAAPTSRAASDNIGPLETRFTPPPACSSVFSATLADDYEGAINLLYGGQCEGNSAVFDSARCMPPGTVPSIATTSGNFGFMAPGYYSPSLFCPHGYSTACSGYGGKGSTFPFSPAEVETAIGCCPT